MRHALRLQGEDGAPAGACHVDGAARFQRPQAVLSLSLDLDRPSSYTSVYFTPINASARPDTVPFWDLTES